MLRGGDCSDVSPLYLEWNTMENMTLKWNHVFEHLNLTDKELVAV